MTAKANTLGRRPDGAVRRYGLEPGQYRLIHVLATRTGVLAYCGYRPAAVISPTPTQARDLETRTDPSVKGFSWCRTCLASLTPQPNPDLWKPK